MLREIASGILVVDEGFGIYLVKGKRGAFLVDSGTTAHGPKIEEAEASAGTKIKAILLTHLHLDHSGGAMFLKRARPHVKIYAHHFAARILEERADAIIRSIQEVLGDEASFYGEAFSTRVDYRVAGGESIWILGRRVSIIHTPGHSPDHLCYLVDGEYLFAGDALGMVAEGQVLPLPFHSPRAYMESLERLAGLRPRLVIPAHFGPGGPELLEKARAAALELFEGLTSAKEPSDIEALLARLAPKVVERTPPPMLRFIVHYLHRRLPKLLPEIAKVLGRG